MPQNRDSETLLDIQRAAKKNIQFKQELKSLQVHSSPLGAYKPRSTQSAILPEISNRTYPPRNLERQTI
jgi:hypothetical protein